jgi:hypothetical protein
MRVESVVHCMFRLEISDLREAISVSWDVIGSVTADGEDLNLMICRGLFSQWALQ